MPRFNSCNAQKINYLAAALVCVLAFFASSLWAVAEIPEAGFDGHSFDDAGLPDNDGKHPIILAHGLFGFDNLWSVDYFYQIPIALRQQGHEVYVTRVPAIASIRERGIALFKQVKRIAERTGKKVDIIAHSMGGLDSRYLISKLGGHRYVRTLATLSTPHRGSKVANVIYETISAERGSWRSMLIEPVINMLLKAANQAHLSRSQLVETMMNLTTDYLQSHFNQEVFDHPDVEYLSYAGYANLKPFDQVNGINKILLPAYLILKQSEGENDGLVSVNSSRWAKFMGKINFDHVDMIGHPFLDNEHHRYVEAYKKVIADIKQAILEKY